MSYPNIFYVGWNDECNHLHGFIDHTETHRIEEFAEHELVQKVAELETQGLDASDSQGLLRKIHGWPVYKH